MMFQPTGIHISTSALAHKQVSSARIHAISYLFNIKSTSKNRLKIKQTTKVNQQSQIKISRNICLNLQISEDNVTLRVH